jgi:hypothetical protein
MSDQHITLKTVYDLRVDECDEPIRYRIPAYQRGYRWTPTQVTQLLEDIREFTQRENPQPDEFYCLQPLVLLPREDGAYEVVDGQQRLTTLLLVLRHFNELASAKGQRTLFTLEYDTRQDLLKFLEDPSPDESATDIDFFHIAKAVTTIEDWFAANENKIDEIKPAFLHKIKVIWFELSSTENPVAAFTRLNVGKIPLTNGELIRALFLRRAKGEEAKSLQLKVAYEWDLLEKELQSADLWSFLTNNVAHSGARIDFLFDLVSRQEGLKNSADEYATFYHFSDKFLAKDIDRERLWLDVKRIFMLLDEWFQDRELFHLVGFLIWDEMDLNEIRVLAEGNPKHVFRERLRQETLRRTLGTGAPSDLVKLREWIADQLDGLDYGRHRQRIQSVLLLFNLATLLENSQSNIRFNFESFKTARWDIEHVRSVAPDRPNSYKGQTEWMTHCLAYLQSASENTRLQNKISDFLALPAKEATDVVFDPLYERILKYFHEADADEPANGIDNLVLLDYKTNRSYKNAVFAVKRHRILSLDRHGIFVPLCTRNVFLKCYNPRVDHVMFWTEQDSDGYRQVMIDTLHKFFCGSADE